MNNFLRACVPCAVASTIKPGRQARLKVTKFTLRFFVVAEDIQTITLETEAGNTLVMLIVDVFTKFVRAVPVPKKRVKNLAQLLLNERTAFFKPVKRLFSDHGPCILESFVLNMAAERLDIKRSAAHPLHQRANKAVEK